MSAGSVIIRQILDDRNMTKDGWLMKIMDWQLNVASKYNNNMQYGEKDREISKVDELIVHLWLVEHFLEGWILK